MTDFLIMTTLCLFFTVTFQLFATLLKGIGKSLKNHFSEVFQKLMELQENQQYSDSMKPVVKPSIGWAIKAQNQKRNEQNLNKKLSKIENLFLKLKVTNIESNRGRTVSISQKWVVVPKNS